MTTTTPILQEPIIYPVTMFDKDDFDLQLNWKERCGSTFALSSYNAKLTLWPSETDRSGAIYTLTNPQVAGEGIDLIDTIPNIWAHILHTNVNFSLTSPGWYVLELQTPTGPSPATDGIWFRLAVGAVTYVL